MIVDTLDKLYQKGLSRRNFMVAAGAAGTVATLAGCNDSFSTSTATVPAATGITDTDILIFALNLEYLEAQFYLYAATGAGLAPADTVGGSASAFGTTAGATIVPAVTKLSGLTAIQQNFVNELAYTEQTHVRLLRSALGTSAPPMPAIDLTFFAPAYVAAQTLAKIPTASQVTNFSPFTSYDNYLVGGFIFEDVGVTAYNGAAPLISAAGVAAGYLATAAGIMAVEAYHAAALRTQLVAKAIAAEVITPGNATATPATVATTSTTYSQFTSANLVIGLRASLGGGNETALTLPNTNLLPGTAPAATAAIPAPVYASSLVAANANALAYARSTDQVHHIVYGVGAGVVSKGGFFPNGTNFKFSTTTT